MIELRREVVIQLVAAASTVVDLAIPHRGNSTRVFELARAVQEAEAVLLNDLRCQPKPDPSPR